MNNSNFIISKSALNDLRIIWTYTVNTWSQVQAERYYSQIMDEINYLASYPSIGKQLDDVRKDYRCSKVKSHIIFYRTTKKQQIEIVRILHQMMDIPNRIKE